MASKKKSKDVTDYLSDMLDDVKKVADDFLGNAGDLQKSASKGVKDVRKVVMPSEDDIKVLRKRVKDISEQVEKVATLKKRK